MTDHQIEKARKVYEAYWESYIRGDLETFASSLDDRFEMIGTSESEICHSKADGIEFLKAQLHEIVGKVEMRNSQINMVPVDQLMLVNEQCDIYVLVGSDWNFYSKIRLSTLLKEAESGWKVTQQHGSFPDMRVQEGETLALEKISKENLELRDAVKRRTAELESKNRELAIEAALEKVRAAAMGMQEPADMLDVCRVISNQLQQFGVEKIRNVQIAIIDENIGQYLCYQYFTPYDKTAVEKTEYLKSPVEQGMVKQMLASRDGYFIGSLRSKELEEFSEHRKAENHFLDPFLDAAAELDYCFLSIGEGGLGLTLYQPMAEEILTLFKRFHQVFSLAYQRFRDIQKAEAQAQEARLEAALEKVRSRSLTIHKSDELKEVVIILFENLKELQIPFTVATLAICIEGSKDLNGFVCGKNEDGLVITNYRLPYFNNKIPMDINNAIENQLDFFVGHYSKEEKNAFFKYNFEHTPQFKNIPEEVRSMILESPSYTISMIPFKYAVFSVNDFEGKVLSKYDVTIIKRFARVFDQAYTRFLDLQKAEAQAREAQIEASMERVRAHAMGLRESEDLGNIIAVIFEELQKLGLELYECSLFFRDGNSRQFTVWGRGTSGDSFLSNYQFIFLDHPVLNAVLEDLERKVPYREFSLEEEEIRSYGDLIFSETDFKYASEEYKQTFYALKKVFTGQALFMYGFLEAVGTEPLPGDLPEVLQRFTQVIDLTYTRYLDLQKAEAQAKEAQIEVALERTRTQSMLMQHSDEIKSISNVFHEQLLNLGIPSEFSYVWLPDEATLSHQFWASWFENEEGENILHSKQVTYPLDKTEPYTAACFAAWANPEIILEEFIPPTEIADFFDVWQELLAGASELKAEFFPDGIYYSEAYMRYGCFGINIRRKLSEEEKHILKRFSIEFERAYTRFLDLKKAEAQAREAQIEAALEKVRSRSLAMHKSDELKEVVSVLFEKLKELQIPFTAVGIATNITASKDLNAFVCGQNEAGLVITNYRLPYFDNQIPKDLYSAIEGQVDYFVGHYSKEEKDSFYEYVIEHTAEFRHLPEDTKRKIFDSTTYTISMVAVKNAVFNVNDFEGKVLVEQEIDIIKRFAKVFDQAYTRFLDLQKAEAQAREAQIEAALEKVRSRTMGMQQSNELADVANVLFSEMNHLVHNLWTCGFVLCERDRQEDEWWLSLDDGFSRGFYLPNVNDYAHATLYEGWLQEEAFRAVQLDGDKLQAHYDWLMRIPVAKNIFDEMEAAGMKRPDWQKLHAAYFSKGYLVLITREPCGEEEIFKRFAQVFDQTYTRFLDLKKAEAQANEVQIELSLERIRSRVTAMQESSDLLDIVVSMRSEFVKLGHEAHYFWHMRWLPERYDKAMTSGDGTKIGMVMTLPRHIHGDIAPVANWEKSNESTHVLAMDAETAVDYVHKMITLGDFERVDPQSPTLDDIRKIGGLTFVMARTTHGEIGFSLPGEVPDPSRDAVDTLVRFAGVFDLAYKRFEDLKTAEKDLIEIKAAREKAEEALLELKATQSQLIQQEKLASLGQLTAGIAHEIKNPLNFVNNFSEVSLEQIDEALEELAIVKKQCTVSQVPGESMDEIIAILVDIKSNLGKIHQHGTRANSIVNSMLQHSRGGTGKKEPTDLNALVKEYVNLCFHGMRAGKNPINVEVVLDLDPELGLVPLIREDFTRVVINLCNNAFDAMRQKTLNGPEDYNPRIRVQTTYQNDQPRLIVQDNGPGIPDEIKDKILQPFFTTKKGTDGTGLGLSITHDIVKAHGGELKVVSKEGEGSEFIINLPV